MDDNPSSEFFNFRKLDIQNADDWKLIQDYLSLKPEDVDLKKIEGETVRNFINFK